MRILMTALLTAGIAVPKEPVLRVPVLVELFTSEGCSSCPPADELLMKLVRDQPVDGVEVIALGQHVDYWDRLGWRDRFASPRFTERQQNYAARFGLRSIYTPQAVVDGRVEFVGNDSRQILRAVKDAARAPKAKIELAHNGDRVSIRVRDLPEVTKGDAAEVWLAVVENDLANQVSRGENTGRRLRHDAVVRGMKLLGVGASFEAPLQLAPDSLRAHTRVVAFVQEKRSGRILGAASGTIE